MKHTLLLIFILLIAANPVFADGVKYTCPMHPNYISETEGTCPICGMDLVQMGGGEEDYSDDAEPNSGERKILFWQAPMDPSYKSDKPGKSPMGMDLVPIYGSETKTGRATISVAPEMIQSIGVRTEKAQIARFGTNVRSYGIVTENVRIQHDISSRVAGWIEKLNITAVGDEISKGDLLFVLYSPDLVSAQQDYLSALLTNAKGRIASVAKRLTSLGVQQQVLIQINKRKKSLENVPFYSEFDGVISKLMVRDGTYIKSGAHVAEIQDYSSVWVNVSVAEKDLAFLKKDGGATVNFPNLGGIERTAIIDYVYPTIDSASRTGQVRMVLDNQNGVLKPGAYADVLFETNIKRYLSIPEDAILQSSEGDFVVIAKGKGRFQPRLVKTGISNRGRLQVISGIKEGDDIVVSSQFLLDSESGLRESFRKMQKAQVSLAELDVDKNQLAMINHLVDASIYIHESIVDGYDMDPKMLMPALKLNDHLLSTFRGTKLQFILENAEDALAQVKKSITDTALQNGLADLVYALKPWLLEGKPQYYKSRGLKLFMDHSSRNLWLQQGGEPANPYGDGHAMEQEWPNLSGGE